MCLNQCMQLDFNSGCSWPLSRVAVEHGGEEGGEVGWQGGQRGKLERMGTGVVSGKELIERGTEAIHVARAGHLTMILLGGSKAGCPVAVGQGGGVIPC